MLSPLSLASLLLYFPALSTLYWSHCLLLGSVWRTEQTAGKISKGTWTKGGVSLSFLSPLCFKPEPTCPTPVCPAYPGCSSPVSLLTLRNKLLSVWLSLNASWGEWLQRDRFGRQLWSFAEGGICALFSEVCCGLGLPKVGQMRPWEDWSAESTWSVWPFDGFLFHSLSLRPSCFPFIVYMLWWFFYCIVGVF